MVIPYMCVVSNIFICTVTDFLGRVPMGTLPVKANEIIKTNDNRKVHYYIKIFKTTKR